MDAVASKVEDDGIPARLVRGLTAGAVAGVVASFAMDRFQALGGPPGGTKRRAANAEPATSKAADKIVETFTGKTVAREDQPLAGQMVHFALGTGLGVAYAIAAEFQPEVASGYGSAFGLAAAAILDETLVPAVGLGTPPWKTAPSVHLYTVASHLVFGVTCDLTRRQVRSTLVPRTASRSSTGPSSRHAPKRGVAIEAAAGGGDPHAS